MSALFNQFYSQLQVYLAAKSGHFCVAYSGGVDSHVLLHLVAELSKQNSQHRFSAVHINHGISPHADAWQQHCEQTCKQLNIPFLSANLSLEVKNRQSLEAVARDARYQAIVERVPPDCKVLLAQHQDDQLETFLLQLKRGAGPKGLSSMGLSTSKHGVTFLRPLLHVGKTEILDYADQHKLTWVEDESNKDLAIDRNFLRQSIIPELKGRWPNLATTVSRSANLCAEQTQLLDEFTATRLEQIKRPQGALDASALIDVSDAWRNQLVRAWLSQRSIPSPSQAQLNELCKLLTAAEDANPCIRWQNWQLRRYQRALFVLPVVDENPAYELDWNGEADLLLPDGLGRVSIQQRSFPGSTLLSIAGQASIRVRFGELTKSFKPQDQLVSKPVKQWFKQWQIPPWQRARIPMLFANDNLVALLLTERVVVANQTVEADTELFVRFAAEAAI